MLFMCQGRPKPGLAPEDQQRAIQLFGAWTPPAGLQIRAHYAAANGGDYVIIETDSVEALIEATATWAPFLTYEVIPIVAVQEGVGSLSRAFTTRASLIS
jgi:hypothetical protein